MVVKMYFNLMVYQSLKLHLFWKIESLIFQIKDNKRCCLLLLIYKRNR